MNSENSKTSETYRPILNLSDKINLKKSDKYVASTIHGQILKGYTNNKFKISAPSWNEIFELPNRSYFVSDIKDYLEFTIKKHETSTDNPPIRIYVNKIEARTTLEVKTGYYLELLTPETIKVHGSPKIKINKDKIVKNASHSVVNEVALVNCNIVNNDYQYDSRVFYAFAPNKSFTQVLNVSPKNFMFSKTFNSEFPYNES